MRWMVAGLCLVTVLATGGAQAVAQAKNQPDSSLRIVSGTVSVPAQIAGPVIREIDDPHSGARWLLMRDRNHPAGPGRLVLVTAASGQVRPSGGGLSGSTDLIPPRPIIRAGDPLVVEENTAVIEARLEAVALGPAMLGATFDVRLKIGGKVARAVALAPGRAAFQSETEARP